MGLNLKNPVVASSSPLSVKVDNVKKMEDAGIGAVALYSLFEEVVQKEQLLINQGLTQGTEHFAEALTYLPDLETYQFESSRYLEHIHNVKNAVDIPVFASLNGRSTGEWWGNYARKVEQAGADGIELNIYDLPTNPMKLSSEVENVYIRLVSDVVKSVSIPVAVKIGPFFSSLPNIIMKFSECGAKAVIIFNRFYQPDIDLEDMAVKSVLHLSTSEELPLRIRWAALLCGKVDIDIAVTGGVHGAQDLLKSIAAGARVAMMTSLLLKKGISTVTNLLSETDQWLDSHGYSSVQELYGVMSYSTVENPDTFERVNYMRMLGSYRAD